MLGGEGMFALRPSWIRVMPDASTGLPQCNPRAAASAGVLSDCRSGAGGTSEGAGTSTFGAEPVDGPAAGGFSRGLLVALGAGRAPR